MKGLDFLMEIPSNSITSKNKISREKTLQNQEVSSNATDKLSNSKQPSSAEQVTLSSKAKSIQQAQKVIKNSTDIRTEKVDRIKKEISEGRFKIESDLLADKILINIITDSTFFK